MDEPGTQLVTHTGFKFQIRPIRRGDAAALQDFFTHVTPEDLRFRFLGSVKDVSHERLRAMIDVDHRQVESYLAFEHDGGPVIAAGMLAGDAGLKTGEVAISIRSDRKNRGVGWEMLRHITQCAREKGLHALQSVEDRSNQSAINLETKMGFSSRPYPDDATLVLLEKTLA